MITMFEGIHRICWDGLREKKIDLIRATYEELLKNDYDVKMYEEQACLGSKGRYLIERNKKNSGWESEEGA